MKKRLISLAVIVAAVLSLMLVPADAGKIPTLYHNDEVWYRDALSPLVERDGIYYVPVGLFEMFDGVSVITHGEENILITNNETGRYISALVSDGTAALDGKIIETTVFREGGTYYIGASLACEVLGLEYEVITTSDGTHALRVYSGETYYLLNDLAEMSRIPDEENGESYVPVIQEDTRKTVYIFTACTEGNGTVYSELCRIGLGFTVCLSDDAERDDVYRASSHGEYCVIPGETAPEVLDKRFCEYSHYNLHALLSTGDEDEDEKNRRAGYAVITPDFTVNDTVYAYSVIDEITEFLDMNGKAYIYIVNSWNGAELVRLLDALDPTEYRTANIR